MVSWPYFVFSAKFLRFEGVDPECFVSRGFKWTTKILSTVGRNLKKAKRFVLDFLFAPYL